MRVSTLLCAVSALLLMRLAVEASAQPLPLPALPYEYDALHPFYSDAALKLHHLGHHQAYTDKLNTALRSLRERGGAEKELAKLGIDAILVRLNDVPADLRTAITNNGGGYVNHDIYWRCLSSPALPEGQARESATLSQLVGRPGPDATSNSPLGQAIARDFGSFEAMRKQFSDMSLALFGSGWVWLYVHVDLAAEGPAAIGTLRLRSTANQDNPQTLDQNGKHVLLLTIDVWEHAYYVDYYNQRARFVDAFWSVVNWEGVEAIYKAHVDAVQAAQENNKTEL